MKSFATVLVLATSAAAIKVSYDGMSKYDAFAELASQAYGFTQYDSVDTSSGYESTGFTGYEADGSSLPSGPDPMDGFGGDAYGWDWADMHGTNSTSYGDYGDYNATSYGDYGDYDKDWDMDFTYDDDETFGWSGEDGTGDDNGPWGTWGDASWDDASWGDAYGSGSFDDFGSGDWGSDDFGSGSWDDPDAMAAFGGDSYGEDA